MTEKLKIAFLICSGVIDPYCMFESHLEILEYPLIQFGVNVRYAGENIRTWAADILLKEFKKGWRVRK